jgi:N-acetylglucosamine-6-sulfatase
MKTRVLIVSLAVSAAMLSLVSPARALRVTTPKPNIILVVTDDQRWDTVWSMETVRRELIAKGVKFTQAHTVDPLCCPSRASILTGTYPHTHGVYGNQNSGGGFAGFDDRRPTIATVLHNAGYRTGLVGKYLNGYGKQDAGRPGTYIPPGWDDWHGLITGNAKDYYGYELSENGSVNRYGIRPADYLTDVLADRARDFLTVDSPKPFFLYWAPLAPHLSAVPSPAYEHAFDDLAPWRPHTYNEKAADDKPRWVRDLPLITKSGSRRVDDFRERQYETLLSVDDGLKAILGELSPAELGNTFVVFTSDNGYQWGEHRLHSKNFAYEENTRVPLVIRWGRLSAGTVSNELATTIDLAPTFAALAGTSMPGTEGLNLLPTLRVGAPLRDEHLIESAGKLSPPFCMLRNRAFTFTHLATGEEEYYGLEADPLQARNVVTHLQPSRRKAIRDRLRALCRPLPPGMPSF